MNTKIRQDFLNQPLIAYSVVCPIAARAQLSTPNPQLLNANGTVKVPMTGIICVLSTEMASKQMVRSTTLMKNRLF
jgi:hypothetical protein